KGGVERGDPRLHRRVGVGQAGVAGVVEVAAQADPGRDLGDGLQLGGDVSGRAHADRVGQAQLVDADLGDRAGQIGDALGGDLALEGTPEGGADRHRAQAPGGGEVGADRLPDREGLGDAGALVALVEGLGGDDHEVDLVHAGRERAVEAATVDDQTGQ